MRPWPEALVIGVLLALAFFHRTGWTPGGLITPGYLVMYRLDLAAILALAAAAGLTWALALAARSRLPLYGRRRWGFCVATSAMIVTTGSAIAPLGALTWNPLGFIVPGLIANAAVHQGPGPTLTGLASVTAATWWALIVLGRM